MLQRHASPALVLSAALLLPALLSAQEAKVRWKVFADYKAKPDEGTVFAKVAQGDAGCWVALRVNGSDPVIGGADQGQLDRTLVAYTVEGPQLIKFDKTKVLWGEGPVAIETIERFGGQFRLIASKPDPENAKLQLIQQVLSPRGLTGKGAQLLADIPYDQLGKGPEYFRPNMAVGFTTRLSVDSTKLLVGLSPQSTRRSAGCPVFAQVFDKQMKRLWANTLEPDAAARTFSILDTRIDPKGAVWYLVKNVTAPEPKAGEGPGYSFTLYRLDSAGQQAVMLKLPGKDFAQDATMDMRPDGSITVAGIHGNEQTARNESAGVFQCVLDRSAMQFDRFKLHPLAKRVEKKEERWPINIVVDRVFCKKNGGTYIVARQSGVETHYVADLSGKKVPKTEQVDGPLHLFELDAQGERKWYRVYDRMLTHENAVPGTVISQVFDDVLFVVLNDAEGNVEKRKLKEPVDALSGRKDVLLVEFKGDGSDKSKMVLEGGLADKLGLVPGRVWNPAPGLIVTTGSTGFGRDKTWPVVFTWSSEPRK
jgi:hypothetical protein